MKNKHFLDIKRQIKNSSLLAKTLFIVAVLLMLLSCFEPSLLGVSGSFVVASVAVFNSDIQRHSDHIKFEIDKAQNLIEFQNFLITIIHQLAGVRSNYCVFFEFEANEHLDYKRSIKIPVLAYVPQFDTNHLMKVISKLGFTSSLISREDAKDIDKKPLSVKARSLTILSFHIGTVEALSKMWELHNDLYHKCSKKPDEKDPARIVFNFETIEDIQQFHNYMLVTEKCVTLTEKVLIYAQAALDYFVPLAKTKIHPDALEKCPIPKLSDKVFEDDKTFDDLSKGEKIKLDNLPYELRKQFGIGLK